MKSICSEVDWLNRHLSFAHLIASPQKTGISARIELPANLGNRAIELGENTLTVSCVICLNGNQTDIGRRHFCL
jgi:hypothetical protein